MASPNLDDDMFMYSVEVENNESRVIHTSTPNNLLILHKNDSVATKFVDSNNTNTRAGNDDQVLKSKIGDPQKINSAQYIAKYKLDEYSSKRTRLLVQLSDKVMGNQRDFVYKERQVSDEFQRQLKDIDTKIKPSVQKDQNELKNPTETLMRLNNRKSSFEEPAKEAFQNLNAIQAEISKIEGAISKLNAKKKELTMAIDPVQLAKVKLSNEKSPLSSIFIWTLVIVYGEQEAAFYWKNFKQQAFEIDKGQDFLERLKGLKYKLSTENLNFTTENMIEPKDHILSEINKANNPSLKKLFEYIQTIYELNIELVSKNNLETKRAEAQIDANVKGAQLEIFTFEVASTQTKINFVNKFEESMDLLEKLRSLMQKKY